MKEELHLGGGAGLYVAGRLVRELIPSSGETLSGAKQGSLAWRPSIILYTFAYKFISKLYQLNKIVLGVSP
jgi:hypothetical protein